MLLGIFLIEVAVTRIVSLGSIIIAALYPVGTLINLIARGANAATIVFSTVCCVIMAAMVIWLHRSNIERLKKRHRVPFWAKEINCPMAPHDFGHCGVFCTWCAI